MPNDTKTPSEGAHITNFIRQAIEKDLAAGKYAQRKWGGEPGPGPKHAGAATDSAKIRTRFPPEPNGYLHIGHAKSICLNFGLAEQYGGVCHMRFDDTNPEKEEQEYVDSILEAVHWLGYHWGGKDENLYHASDYFDFMYQAAEYLVTSGNAYVDSQSAEELRANRGSFSEAGKESPYRSRTPEENLKLLREMRDGKHADGAHVLRAKIDMRSPNINLRDPAIYRIKKAEHHRTGGKWCIYPMYTYAHPIEDAVEGVTHSICTLEFEDQRPFYDWLLAKLADGGLLKRPLPKQIEFARLNLTHVLLSKRKLIELVQKKHVDGWDDPRMPTLAGARRRGYTPEGFRRFVDKIGVAKENSWIPYEELEGSMRDHLNEVAPRRMAVLDPIKLVIDNYPAGKEELLEQPNHPQKPETGKRKVPFSRELWIEREDYQETPQKGFFRLFPGNEVRLRFAYVIKCTGMKDGAVHCTYHEDSKSGTPGSDKYKVKGNIHWVSAKQAFASPVHLYDRLFKVADPQGNEDLNPDSKKTMMAQLEPSLQDAKPGESFQFERHGYFIRDREGFNRSVTLRDSWAKT